MGNFLVYANPGVYWENFPTQQKVPPSVDELQNEIDMLRNRKVEDQAKYNKLEDRCLLAGIAVPISLSVMFVLGRRSVSWAVIKNKV